MSLWPRLLLKLARFRSNLRVANARLCGAQLGADCVIGPDCELHLGDVAPLHGIITLADRTQLDRGVILHPHGGSIATGIDVYIGPYSVIYGHGGVVIGKDTLISMHCRILSSDHSVPPLGTIIRSVGDVKKPTRIGADVWLGAGATVLGGVTIGDGCVIGAGAVVAHDLPIGTVAVGVPARTIAQRDR